MGRWLSQIKKASGSSLPKLTKLDLGGTQPRFQPKKTGFDSFDSALLGAFSVSKTVCCDNCRHFTPDKVGDGVGIGACNLGITWTQECRGRMPLYRFADRHCSYFSKV